MGVTVLAVDAVILINWVAPLSAVTTGFVASAVGDDRVVAVVADALSTRCSNEER